MMKKEYSIVITSVAKTEPASNEFENKIEYRKGTTVERIDKNLQHGSICKQKPPGLKSLISKSQEYKIRFPTIALDKDLDAVNVKTLIIAAVMMLDICFFDRQCCVPGLPF